MAKIPDFDHQQDNRLRILRILQQDATQRLNNPETHEEEKRLLKMLLSQGEMVGTIDTWQPSLEARQKIADLTEGQLFPNDARRWLADEIRRLVLESNEHQAISLLEETCNPHILNTIFHVAGKYQSLFYRIGEVWLLAYGGKKAIIKDTPGIRFIAGLLESPLRDYSPAQFRGVQTDGISLAQMKAEGLSIETDRADPPSSTKEIKAWFEQQLLKIETAPGPEERMEAIEEFTRVKKDLSKIVSVREVEGRLSFRFRSTTPNDKARANITIQIRDAVKKINKVHAELGLHLEKTIKTGSTFRYALPDREPGFFVKR